jgi:hypothetical protein
MSMSNRQTILHKAETKGELVYAFNQRDTVPSKQSGAADRGNEDYCAGLSIKWLGLRLAGRDYAFDPGKKLLTDPGKDARTYQDTYEKQGRVAALAWTCFQPAERRQCIMRSSRSSVGVSQHATG